MQVIKYKHTRIYTTNFKTDRIFFIKSYKYVLIQTEQSKFVPTSPPFPKLIFRFRGFIYFFFLKDLISWKGFDKEIIFDSEGLDCLKKHYLSWKEFDKENIQLSSFFLFLLTVAKRTERYVIVYNFGVFVLIAKVHVTSLNSC